MGAARKMVVEVTSARGLMPKDGQGSANPYCVLDYDGQRKRTKVKTKNLDPNWNEKVLKHRYERLRGVAGRLQNALGELATTGERLHSLLSWRDPRATAILVTFCLVTAIVLYVTPFQAVAVLLSVYVLRHPRFRDPLPTIPINFFNRLPSQSDRIL